MLPASLILVNLIADVILLEPTDLFSQRRVEMILYTVICSPRDVLRDFRPLVTVHFVRLDEHKLLVRIPWRFSHFGVQVVVPSLSALFTITI